MQNAFKGLHRRPAPLTPDERRIEMKLTKTLYCYLDDEELKELDSDAASLRLTRSEFVRKQIRESEMIPTPKMNYAAFTQSLNPILDRVKSVADRLWHKVVFDVPMLREALRDIEKLIPKIEKEIKQCEQYTTE
ncbi:MAG: ribbon-helix-helix protein, CopG family [Ruminococcaceae bacterium]|nr:ribbon-helix-helix protein, CopG family [Oscillospiraceae bacterium]